MMLLAGLILCAPECCAMKKFGTEIAKKYIRFQSHNKIKKGDVAFFGGCMVVNGACTYVVSNGVGYVHNSQDPKVIMLILPLCASIGGCIWMTTAGIGSAFGLSGLLGSLYAGAQGASMYTGYCDGKHRGKYGLEQ